MDTLLGNLRIFSIPGGEDYSIPAPLPAVYRLPYSLSRHHHGGYVLLGGNETVDDSRAGFDEGFGQALEHVFFGFEGVACDTVGFGQRFEIGMNRKLTAM